MNYLNTQMRALSKKFQKKNLKKFLGRNNLEVKFGHDFCNYSTIELSKNV